MSYSRVSIHDHLVLGRRKPRHRRTFGWSYCTLCLYSNSQTLHGINLPVCEPSVDSDDKVLSATGLKGVKSAATSRRENGSLSNRSPEDQFSGKDSNRREMRGFRASSVRQRRGWSQREGSEVCNVHSPWWRRERVVSGPGVNKNIDLNIINTKTIPCTRPPLPRGSPFRLRRLPVEATNDKLALGKRRGKRSRGTVCVGRLVSEHLY